MLFNSIEFAIFLPVVFGLYWLLARWGLRAQNLLIVVASYVFYGWWDWRFLSLIFASSLVDFLVGLGLAREERPGRRRLLLSSSLAANLGLLGFFKYYDFFLENLVAGFSLFGMKLEASTLNIVLPVGISFYTFQTMSYTIDVYRRQIEATRDAVAFFAFVSFFPQLVAGPIERARNLLLQFYAPRTFDHDQAVDGLRQVLWGLFKKIVIADRCGHFADAAFRGSPDYGGSDLLLGVFFFAIQIYGDFSGYSDIAIGTARLFGFELRKNFAFPYFSRDIAEFWRRWHISLSTWFRDYVYIPLGGSRGSVAEKVRNTFVIFLVSGFWHGANWTFLVWGALNALYFLPLLLSHKNRQNLDTVAHGRLLPTARELAAMATTFALTLVAWVFFRAANVGAAWRTLAKIFSSSVAAAPRLVTVDDAWITALLLVGFFTVEWLGREREFALADLGSRLPRPARWTLYYALALILAFAAGPKQQFIYFQF